MAVTETSSGPEAEFVAPRAVVDGLAGLVRSIDSYDLLSNGVREEVLTVAPAEPATVEGLDDDAIATMWHEVVPLLRKRRLEPVLSLHALPFPRYPIGSDPQVSDNGLDGPQVAIWDQPLKPEHSTGGWNVLGFDVGFPVGIPACELTSNADWIEYYARMGFHLLTYRTVRNRPTPGSPYDWVFVDGIRAPWTSDTSLAEVRRVEGPMPPDLRRISTATSYLAPSAAPEIWMPDVKEARRRLDDLGGHHLLIVSVTDSVPADQKSIETLSADFVAVALRAESAGAQAIECYLARARTKVAEGLERCERDVDTSIAIVESVRAALDRKTRLLIKLSAAISDESLERIVVPLAQKGLIDGVSGISPVEVDRVTQLDGRTLWDERRPGVAGFPLRKLSEDFVRRLASLKAQHGLKFDIIAMGGVMTAKDVATYLDLGASAVQIATAASCNPHLAEEAHALYVVSLQKASAEAEEIWEGIVTAVDVGAGRFWAQVTVPDNGDEEMEAEFELDEVHPDELSEVSPGATFRWTTGLVQQEGRRVRRSSVHFETLDPLTEDDILTGKELAEQVGRVFGPAPDFG